MATPTYTLIDSTVLGSAASSVTFSTIPATYRDLVLVCEVKGSGGNAVVRVQINSDTGSNYSYVLMQGNGTTASSSSGTDDHLGSDSGTTTDAVLVMHQFLDYSATDKHKTVLTRTSKASATVRAYAQRWANTSAISSLYIYPAANQFAAGSTFYLFGIAA